MDDLLEQSADGVVHAYLSFIGQGAIGKGVLLYWKKKRKEKEMLQDSLWQNCQPTFEEGGGEFS